VACTLAGSVQAALPPFSRNTQQQGGISQWALKPTLTPMLPPSAALSLPRLHVPLQNCFTGDPTENTPLCSSEAWGKDACLEQAK